MPVQRACWSIDNLPPRSVPPRARVLLTLRLHWEPRAARNFLCQSGTGVCYSCVFCATLPSVFSPPSPPPPPFLFLRFLFLFICLVSEIVFLYGCWVDGRLADWSIVLVEGWLTGRLAGSFCFKVALCFFRRAPKPFMCSCHAA